ncbi:hypothetical protein [Dokdonella sp.]|uniref:hypothetical protein n=1 Tax=Dokdonella sp. TaxID=2291710 RepID=UPI003783040A
MPLPRAKLDEMLDGLEAALPKMLIDYPDDDLFWPYFSGHAGVIEGSASAEDDAHVRARLAGMLQRIGKVRPEDSGRRGAGHG